MRTSETHSTMKWILPILLTGAWSLGAMAADNTPERGAATDTGSSSSQATPEQSLTAEDQGNSPTDRALTSRIRIALIENDQLSVSGKNVKIITQNGKVTLRGSVASDAERATIHDAAESIAGKDNVSDHLEVKP